MALYPLVAPHSHYRGTNPDRRRKALELYRIGERAVAYINLQMEETGRQSAMFSYAGVAHTLKVDPKQVETILQQIGGGGNGITVVRRDLPIFREPV